MATQTSPRCAHSFSAAIRLTVVMLATMVGISTASAADRGHVPRQASLTIPTIPLSDSTTASGSGSVSILPIATTTTALTTSIGPNGTSTFLTTVTTLVGPGPSNTTTNVSATATSTSTAFPSLGSYSPCVANCLQLGVSSSNCSSITDTACYCASSAFTSSLVQCANDQCSSELSTAENLAQSFCNLSSPSVSLAFPAPAVSANTSGSPSSDTSAPASASPTDNGAARLNLGHTESGLRLGLGLGLVGMIIGALIC